MQSLRSWLKQERAAASNSRWITTLRTGILLLLLLTGLEGFRRYDDTRRSLGQRQREQLQLLQSIVHDSHRPLGDWAQWDDIYEFAEGRNPTFLDRLLRTTALLDDGGVMAIHDGQGRQLALEGADSRDRSPDSALSRCLLDVARQRLRLRVDHMALICPSESGPLIGGIEVISDTDRIRRSEASLSYLIPLPGASARTPLAPGLEDLSRQLLLNPGDATEGRGGRHVLQPPIWTSGGRQAMVREPPLLNHLISEWLALSGLMTGAALLALALRMQWMLGQRRLQLQQKRGEGLVARRIRSSERELSALLDQVRVGGDGAETRAFAQLLQRREAEVVAPGKASGTGPNPARLAERFELVLQTARSLALLDPITGLANRSYFLERLHWESERSRKQHRSLALLFINIEKFKEINETYGHNTGDATLHDVASELRRLIGENDFLARFGGDEFSLILNTAALGDADESTIRDHAHQRALELLERFQQRANNRPERIKVSLSIGIAVSDPNGTDAEELIRRSDMAMVLAKTRRQRRVSVFDIESDWDALTNYRLFNALQSDIQHAPERFAILFQPIVDAAGQLQKVEALTRWRNPEHPDIPADVFFALAERYRQMPELGRLLLDHTMGEWNRLRRELGRPDLGLSVNISPSQLSEEGFSPWLLAQLSQQRIEPERVTVEITESAVVETSPELTDNLESLRRAGVQLALDDFGTGYSSLRLLMWLRPDELKIDKSFVVAATEDPVAHQIVRLLSSLAQQMRLTLVAEGIETETVFSLLREAGIERYQGYLFSRPLTRSDLVAASAARASAWPRPTPPPA